MAGEGISIGNGPNDIHPKGSLYGKVGNVNCRAARSNKLNRKRWKGNGLKCPKIPQRRGGKG